MLAETTALTPQEMGGLARKEALAPKQRSEIARAAAKARWNLPRATHEGQFSIGDKVLTVAVLDGGIRVVRALAVLSALGRQWRGQYKRTGLPSFLEAKNLSPFITNELQSVLEPIEYMGLTGNRQIGYRADLMPLVCEVYLNARDEGVLTSKQRATARLAELITRALSRVGIAALIDEATGFQEVRDRQALQAILDKFLREEQAKWAKRFPDDFYREIFRLNGWEWRGMKVNRPQVVAHYTRDIVYTRIAPDLLSRLEELNPKDEKGRRPVAHFQWLTDEIGLPALSQHLHAAVALMRASTTWKEFKGLLDKALPVKTRLSDLPLFDEKRNG